jgi:ion channel-forming bestrophin family protein
MIEYDPHDWRSHLLDFRGSLLREIFARVFSSLVWAVFVVMALNGLKYLNAHYYHDSWLPVEWFTISSSVHSMMGFAIGLLLVFRTNSSYDRFWEGRKLWGGIVNETRNLARAVCVHLQKNILLRNEIIRWTIAFPYASMARLRGKKELGAIADRLPAAEIKTLLQAEHIPLEISRRLTGQLKKSQEQGLISDYLFVAIDQNVQLLIDYLGGCERIHKTPLPFAYIVHLRRVMLLYVYTLPFALYREWGWTTVAATLCVAFIFFGIEEIGVEIEDPFEGELNDIPLESICATIDRNLSALIGDGDLTLPEKPKLE